MAADLPTKVQQAIDAMVESGAERGLQVAVYHRGEQVVDARQTRPCSIRLLLALERPGFDWRWPWRRRPL
jgi:hypothetical protein